MLYKIKVGKPYEIASTISLNTCDCCRRTVPVQELPVEHNAGELYSAYLCCNCLIQLAKEIIELEKSNV